MSHEILSNLLCVCFVVTIGFGMKWFQTIWWKLIYYFCLLFSVSTKWVSKFSVFFFFFNWKRFELFTSFQVLKLLFELSINAFLTRQILNNGNLRFFPQNCPLFFSHHVLYFVTWFVNNAAKWSIKFREFGRFRSMVTGICGNHRSWITVSAAFFCIFWSKI